MAGTDAAKKKTQLENIPAIILINTQLGENIGGAARAMLNCGLTDLRLVDPRDGWPNERATAMSAGALDIMPPVQTYNDTKSACEEFHHIYAATARPRDLAKPVITAKEAAKDMAIRRTQNQKTAILFGAERTGMTNNDIALAHTVIQIPLNSGFSSLNLAQAVLVTAYEFYQSINEHEVSRAAATDNDNMPAQHNQMDELIIRLENELENHGFFKSENLRPHMKRNIRTMLGRAEMTTQEVRTFHGIISALIGKKIQK